MRKFKFRVWNGERFLHPEEFIMIYNDETQSFTASYLLPYGGGFRDVENGVIQQFTGILDKNGKEIYEGDITKTTGVGISFVLQDLSTYTVGRITWLRESWCLCQENVGGNPIHEYVECYCHPCYSLEVIGNVFENPDLLK